jgi:Rrf2 family iron-sulfur cluster assembly transcriptional regulator
MKLNSRSRIAINAILDVAVHGAGAPTTLASVSERQKVSLSYLEQLFRRLRASGLVKASRGPGGGYRVSKRLSAISVADVAAAVDATSVRRKTKSAADLLWAGLDRHLSDYLRTISLASIIEQSGHVAHQASPREVRYPGQVQLPTIAIAA